VVFTKMDLLGEEYAPPISAPGAFGLFAISAAAREGLDTLTAALNRVKFGRTAAEKAQDRASREEASRRLDQAKRE